MVNTFTLTNAAYETLGMAIDPQISLINHSCEPNAFIRCDTTPTEDTTSLSPHGTTSVHALRSIAKDEEITISYIDTSMLRSKRQQELKERYFFDCACELCEQTLDNLVDLYRLRPGTKAPAAAHQQSASTVSRLAFHAEQLQQAVDHMDKSPREQTGAILSDMKIFTGVEAWPLYHEPWLRLRERLITRHLANGNFYDAMLHSAALLRLVDPVLFPQIHHPVRLMRIYATIRLIGHCCASESMLLRTGNKSTTSAGQSRREWTVLQAVLVVETNQALRTNFATADPIEKLLVSIEEDLRSAGFVTSYEKAPEAIQMQALSMLDKNIASLLKDEGISPEMIEYHFSRVSAPFAATRQAISRLTIS
jgi:hypothetical protein